MKFEDFEFKGGTYHVEKWVYSYRNFPITIYPTYNPMENPFKHKLIVPVLYHKEYSFPSVIDIKSIVEESDDENILFKRVIKAVEELYGKIVHGENVTLHDNRYNMWLGYSGYYSAPTFEYFGDSFIGWIFITRGSIKKWKPDMKYITKNVIKEAIELWNTQVAPRIDDYVAGNMFDIVVELPNDVKTYFAYGHEIDDILSNIESEIDKYILTMEKRYKNSKIKTLKALIKNKISLEKRQKRLQEIELFKFR